MEKSVVLTVGGIPIWSLPGSAAFFYKSGIAIDADGSPHAYGPDGKGLDFLANAGHPGNWWGVVTDTGKADGSPVVQGPGDPAPGFYVSATSLSDPHLPRTNPRKYVDAETVPYFVLPGRHQSRLSPTLKLGDVALVVNGKTGAFAYAIYADTGPADKIGEGSIALARALGVGSDPKRGNAARDIVYLVFPASGDGQLKSKAEIEARGRTAFAAWGGFPRMVECFPEYAATLPRQ